MCLVFAGRDSKAPHWKVQAKTDRELLMRRSWTGLRHSALHKMCSSLALAYQVLLLVLTCPCRLLQLGDCITLEHVSMDMGDGPTS